MADFALRSSNFVVLAESHNPSLLTELFLVRSGMLNDNDQIDRSNYVVTPGLSSIRIIKPQGAVKITLDPGTLRIESSDAEIPFILGQRYCHSLSHIIGKAYGINFDYLIKNIDAKKWFEERNSILYKSSILSQMVYRFDENNQIVSVFIENQSDSTIMIKFNFHTDLKKDANQNALSITLNDIVDIESKMKKNESVSIDFIKTVFGI